MRVIPSWLVKHLKLGFPAIQLLSLIFLIAYAATGRAGSFGRRYDNMPLATSPDTSVRRKLRPW